MKSATVQARGTTASESRRAAYARPRVLWAGATMLMMASMWWASAQTSKPAKPAAKTTTTKSVTTTKSSVASLADLPAMIRAYGKRRAQAATKTGASGITKARFALTERDLTPNTPSDEREPDFSPNGDLIAFASNGTDTNSDGLIDSVGTNYHIWIMNRDGSNQRQITGLTTSGANRDDNQNQRQPSWLPDGNQIVFTANGLEPNGPAGDTRSAGQLYIVRPFTDGNFSLPGIQPVVEQRTFYTGTGSLVRPAGGANGLAIAFAHSGNIDGDVTDTDATDGTGLDIFSVTPGNEAQSLVRLTGGTNDAAGRGVIDTNPAFSIINPTTIFWSSGRVNNTGTAQRIWSMVLPDGSGKQQITDPTARPGGTALDIDDWPSLSIIRGGFTQRVAFHSNSKTDAGDTNADFNVWSLTPPTTIETAGNPAQLESNPTSSPARFTASQLPATDDEGGTVGQDTVNDIEPTFSRSSASAQDAAQLAFASQRRTAAIPGSSLNPDGTTNAQPDVVNRSGGPGGTHDIWVTASQDFTPPVLVPISSGNARFPVVAPGPQAPFNAPRTFETGLRAGQPVQIAFVLDERESGLNTVTVNVYDANTFAFQTFTTRPNSDIPVDVNLEMKPAAIGSAAMTFTDAGAPSEKQAGAVAGDGVYYCSGTFTPATAGDFYFDIVASDNQGNSFTYDNIYGFSTRQFIKQSTTSDLFVADYTQGQVFPSTTGDSRFFRMQPITSYYLTNPVSSPGPIVGIAGTATTFSNVDVWHVISRGQIPEGVFDAYAPTETQQIDPVNGANDVNPQGTPSPFTERTRRLAVASSSVIWASPYTGTVFAGPGTLADSEMQRRLSNFLEKGGRAFFSGRDILFGLTNGGATANDFLRDELGSAFGGEVGGAPNNIITAAEGRFTNFPGNNDFAGQPFNTEDLNNLQLPTRDTSIDATTRGQNTFLDAAINQITNGQTGGGSGTDIITPQTPPNGQLIASYTIGGARVGQRIERTRTNTFQSRAVLFSFGLEGVNRRYAIGNNDVRFAINIRQRIAQTLKAYFKTGGISGRVVNNSTNLPVPNFLLQVIDSVTQTRYFVRTDASGNYEILGLPSRLQGDDLVPPGSYSVRPAVDASGNSLNPGFEEAFAGTPLGIGVLGPNISRGNNFRVIPAPLGSLSGVAVQSSRTFADRTDDSPLPNVRVLLRSLVPSSVFPGGGFFVQVTTTDAGGRFNFTGVPTKTPLQVVFNPEQSDVPSGSGLVLPDLNPGDTSLVGNPNFGRRQLPDALRPNTVYPTQTFTGSIYLLNANPFILNDGDRDTPADDPLELDASGNYVRGGPILIPVGRTINGRVLLNGVPLAGATVELLRASDGQVIERTTSATTTGDYAFFDIPAGDYIIRATFTRPNGVVITGQTGTLTLSGRDLSLADGTEIKLFKQDVSGRVLVNGGSPNEQLLVELLRDGVVVDSTQTALDGTYQFLNVEIGTYAVRATRRGITKTSANFLVKRFDPISNTGGDVVAPTIDFFARTITGIVTVNGVPTGGLTVQLLDASGAALTPPRETTTAADGTFSFTEVDNGTFIVRTSIAGRNGTDVAQSTLDVASDTNITLPLFLHTITGRVTLNSVVQGGVTVELSQDGQVIGTTTSAADGTYSFDRLVASASGTTFTLRAAFNGDSTQVSVEVVRGGPVVVQAPDLDLRLQSISGRVTLNGKPRAATRVELLRRGIVIQRTTTDSAGNFVFSNVAEGVFVLRTSALGDTVALTVTVVRGTDLTGIELRLLLQRVSGRVLLNGAPIGGATVQLIRNGTVAFSTSTNSLGRYSISNVPAGFYSVRAFRFGDTAQINVRVIRGRDLAAPDVNLLLMKVAGRVTLNGLPEAGATVQLIKNGQSIRRATTDIKGQFLLTDIAAGPYIVRASKDGDQTEIAIVVKRGFNFRGIELDLRLQSVTGRVTVNGRVATGITVQLVQGTRVIQNTQTGIGGIYTFQRVAAGDYTVRASRAGDTAEVRVRVLRTGIARAPELQLKVASVRGLVTVDGRPRSGIVVQLLNTDGAAVRRTTTDANGNYEFAEVPVGRYTVRASATLGGSNLTVERGIVVARGEAVVAPNLPLRTPGVVPTPTPDPVADEFQPGETYQISVPYTESTDPFSTTTVEEAFTAPPLAADGTENYRIFRYDAVNSTYVQLTNRAAIRRGEGYFLQPLARSISIRRPENDPTRKPTSALTFEIVLRRNPSKPANDRTNGYNLIGFPFDPNLVSSIDWANSEVIAPDGRRFTTLSQAVAAGILDGTLFTLDEVTNEYVPVSNTMEPFKGYYARTFVDGVRVILKANR